MILLIRTWQIIFLENDRLIILLGLEIKVKFGLFKCQKISKCCRWVIRSVIMIYKSKCRYITRPKVCCTQDRTLNSVIFGLVKQDSYATCPFTRVIIKYFFYLHVFEVSDVFCLFASLFFLLFFCCFFTGVCKGKLRVCNWQTKQIPIFNDWRKVKQESKEQWGRVYFRGSTIMIKGTEY